jgi:hypothetical protein
MGTVNRARCDHWHGLLALRAVGQLEADDEVALDAHLDGCAECRDEAAELATVTAALPRADPAHFESEDQPPPELARSVLGRIQVDAAEARSRAGRRRRVRWLGGGAVLGAAAAAVIALVLVLAGGRSAQTLPRTVALRGPAGVDASVQLVSEKWGTEVKLQESGLPGGRVLWVSMGSTANTSWMGGSYTTVAHATVHATFPCALPADKIDQIWVRDSSGHTVLWSGYAV